jgi:hypothetical protein
MEEEQLTPEMFKRAVQRIKDDENLPHIRIVSPEQYECEKERLDKLGKIV